MDKRLLLAVLSVGWQVSQAQPVPVSVQRLGDVRVEREFRAPASVLSANRAIITSEVTALIEVILVDVGASVDEGELLIRLDDDNARLSVAQAQANLKALEAQIVEAKQRLIRAEDLSTESYISDDELVSRQTAVAVLEATHQAQLVAIEVAELSLSRTRIIAPFDATVVQRQAQAGSFAQPGTQLLTLVQSDGREVDAELDPQYASSIAAGANVRYVSFGRDYPVEILRQSDVIEPDTRRLRARFRFSNEAAPIGSSGEIVWKEIPGVIPVGLIVQRGMELGVFAVIDGRAEFIEIPDAQEGRPAILDLPDDTLIVSGGQSRIQQGDELSVSAE